jgi:hypothetical protein
MKSSNPGLALEISKYGLSVLQQKDPIPLSLADTLIITSLLDNANASAFTIIFPLLFFVFSSGRIRSPSNVYLLEPITLDTVVSQSPIWSL